MGIIIVYRYITIKPHFVPESPYAVFGGIIHGFSLSHAPLSEEPFVLLSITWSAKALFRTYTLPVPSFLAYLSGRPHPFTRSVGGDEDVRWVTCGNISLDLAPGATHFQIHPPYRAKPARRGQWMIDNWEETAYQTSWCKVAELIFDCLKPVSSPLECIYVGSCQNHASRLREIVMRQLAWNDLQGFLFHISTDGWLMAHAALSLILSLNHTTFELVSDSYYGGELMP